MRPHSCLRRLRVHGHTAERDYVCGLGIPKDHRRQKAHTYSLRSSLRARWPPGCRGESVAINLMSRLD